MRRGVAQARQEIRGWRSDSLQFRACVMKNWQQTRRDVFRLARFLRGSGDVVFLRWSSEKITESTGNVSKALTFFSFL